MFNINFANDWSRTADLWYRKRPLYQLSHNHNFKLLCYEKMATATGKQKKSVKKCVWRKCGLNLRVNSLRSLLWLYLFCLSFLSYFISFFLILLLKKKLSVSVKVVTANKMPKLKQLS